MNDVINTVIVVVLFLINVWMSLWNIKKDKEIYQLKKENNWLAQCLHDRIVEESKK